MPGGDLRGTPSSATSGLVVMRVSLVSERWRRYYAYPSGGAVYILYRSLLFSQVMYSEAGVLIRLVHGTHDVGHDFLPSSNRYLKRYIAIRHRWGGPWRSAAFTAGQQGTSVSESSNNMLKSHLGEAPHQLPLVQLAAYTIHYDQEHIRLEQLAVDECLMGQGRACTGTAYG